MNRGSAYFVAGIAIVLTLVGLGYLVILAEEEPPPVAKVAAPPPVAALAAQLADVSGVVEVRRGGGNWSQAQGGAALEPGVDVRTGQGATAAVNYGEGVRVNLEGGTELRVAAVEPEALRFVMGEGLVFADVTGGKRLVQFTNKDGKAVAETRDGALYVAGNDQGDLRAAVTRGEASLTANGKTVVLKPGFVSVAKSGAAPASPTAMPKTLLLKMRWPDGATAKAKQRVTGEATPGARLRLGDKVIWVGESGRVDAVVELKEGDNKLRAELVDVGGKRLKQESPTIRLDTKAPPQAVETSPEMWNQPR